MVGQGNAPRQSGAGWGNEVGQGNEGGCCRVTSKIEMSQREGVTAQHQKMRCYRGGLERGSQRGVAEGGCRGLLMQCNIKK